MCQKFGRRSKNIMRENYKKKRKKEKLGKEKEKRENVSKMEK